MLTMFTFISGSYGSALLRAQITSLERERLIYYDAISKIQMVHNEWTLIMYYNIKTYWEGTRRTENYFLFEMHIIYHLYLMKILTYTGRYHCL